MNWPRTLARRYDRAAWARGRAQEIVADYHRLAYDTERHAAWTWMGHEMWKDPVDAIMYAEVIHDVRPAFIIECGTYLGGSALFFAHCLDTIGHGHVVTIDTEGWSATRPVHPRIEYVLGSSVDPLIVDYVRQTASVGPVMVSLDSDHTHQHVISEMDAYGPMVTPGSYMVVEDGNVNGHPVLPDFGPGPYEAVERWLPRHREFFLDERCTRLLLSQHPNGWLKRR